MNDQLLAAIRERGQKQTEFGRGILTADKYVSTIQDCIGIEACNRFLAKGRSSFNDILTKAANTLVYSNDEMVVEEKNLKGALKDVELPKNTLMVFKHVLTSASVDRDGDVLHSDGAAVDSKMLLLWQHAHTLPIGKYLATVTQNKKKLVVASAIVDVNALAHDAAVMIDNDMGRFSHGFRALEYTEMEEGKGFGFDITQFEIMEESLVSVPSNIDAEQQEVLLSMIEGKQLTSSLMKHVGRGIREQRNIQVPGVSVRYRERLGDYSKELTCSNLADLKTAADAGLIGGKQDENKPDRSQEAGPEGAGTGTPEKADDGQNQGAAEEPANKEVTPELTQKQRLVEVARSAFEAWKRASRDLHDADDSPPTIQDPEMFKAVLERYKEYRKAGILEAVDAKEAMAIFLTKASPEERKNMTEVLAAMEQSEQVDITTEQYRALVGSL